MISIHSTARWLQVCALGLMVAAPAVARAEVIVVDVPRSSGSEADFKKAKASSEDATAAFDNGDVKSAEVHAQAAYRLYPNASTALFVASVYRHTKQNRKAFEWLLKALNHGPTDALVEQIEPLLKAVGADTGMATLKVETRPQGAAVEVDGTALGGVTFAGVTPGEHEINASADGHTDGSQRVTTAAGQIHMVTLELVATSGGTLEGDADGLTIGGWILVGLGAALAIGGGVMTGLAVADADGLDPARPDYGAKLGDATTQHDVGWALLGVGAAALIGGAVMVALGGEDDGGASTAAAIAPMAGGGVVVMGGRF